jgi:hypothetical protein
MRDQPVTVIVMVAVWIFCLVAALVSIRRAFCENLQPNRSKLKSVVNNLRFRFNLVFGLVLIGFVMFGVVWLATRW